MTEFWQTRMGVRFFEAQLPELTLQLKRIADAVVRLALPLAPSDLPTTTIVGRPADVADAVRPKTRGLQQELFFVIPINVHNRMLEIVEVARGTVHGVEVHPREVFRPAIRLAAAGVVLAHNHPSGDPTPSFEDIELTRRLKAAGELLGIPVVDHVVVADDAFRSIAEMMGVEL